MSPIAVGVGLLPLGVGDAPPAALDLAGVVAQVLTPPLIVAEYIDDWGRGLWGSCGGEGVHHEFWTSEGSKNITTKILPISLVVIDTVEGGLVDLYY